MILEWYVHESINNVYSCLLYYMEGKQWIITNRSENPFGMGYETELENDPVLDALLASYYQSHISVFRSIVELGRIYINAEVSKL